MSETVYYLYDEALDQIEGRVKAVVKPLQEANKGQAEAFNRVAEALEALTGEIKGLRADLNPELSKEKIKLPAAPPPKTP